MRCFQEELQVLEALDCVLEVPWLPSPWLLCLDRLLGLRSGPSTAVTLVLERGRLSLPVRAGMLVQHKPSASPRERSQHQFLPSSPITGPAEAVVAPLL